VTTLATFSLEDVCEALGKSADWTTRRIAERKAPHLRVGRTIRFTAEQAAAFIESFTVTEDDTDTAPDEDDGDPLRSQTSRSRSRHRTAA
jgi:hypothetical protein